MEIEYTKDAREHMLFWIKSGNKAIQKKIDLLIENMQITPFSGIGKPEALKHEPNLWSRRIDSKHRLVYEVSQEENIIYIYRLKGHYKD